MPDYYVSPSGRDTNSGSQAAPFQTVVRGLNAARAGDRVILRAGIYRENTGWFPGNAEAGKPISIESYPGEKATLSALARLTGWQPFDLTGGKAIYRALMPFTMCGNDSAVAGEDFITCNGVPLNEAQWPAPNPESYPQKISGWATVDSYTWLTDPSTPNATVSVQIQDAALSVFPQNSLTGSRITLLPGARWTFVSGTVSGNVGNKLTFSMKSPGGEAYYAPDNRSLYFLFGKKIFLSSPGSWWRDAASNYLYVWLPDSSNPNSSVVEAKKESKILDFYARNYYKFKNLTFVGAPLSIYDASDISIEGCTFKWYSHRLYFETVWGWINPAFYINKDNIKILDCDFADSFGTVISLEEQNGLTVQNCVISNTGGVTFGGTNSKFTKNTVADTPGGCFKLTGNTAGSEVSLNDFGFAGSCFTDGGIFLVERNSTGLARISRNIFHDGIAPSDGEKEFYGTAGIYFESDVSNFVFDRNIVCRTTSPALNLVANGGGRTLENIKFYNNTGDGAVYWVPSWAGNPAYPGVTFTNNYFEELAPNTGYHPDLQFSKNAFKVLPEFLNGTDNISATNPKFEVDYFLAPDSPLKFVARRITGITSNPFPDIGAREGLSWVAGAVLRQSDLASLVLETYSVNDSLIVFVLSGLPFGRHFDSSFKMKLGSGTEAVGKIAPYSKTFGQTVWARVGTGAWVAIGTIAPPPALSSLSSGTGLPEQEIILYGSGFAAGCTILFGGAAIAPSQIAPSLLRASVPVVNPGAHEVQILNPDGQKSGLLIFSTVVPLSLNGISESTVGLGQQIQLTGEGFAAGATAIFDPATEVATDFSSSTLLGVQVPILPAGQTSVRVKNPDGTQSGSLALTVILKPSIASFSPNPIRPGQELTVVGENFGTEPYLSISGIAVVPSAFTETLLAASVPLNIPAGTVQFRIVGEVGASSPANLTIERPPVLLSVAAPSAPVGARIGLTGSDLTANCQIFFGEAVGILPVFSGTTASAIVPAIGAGTVGIKIVSDRGLESAEIDFEVRLQPAILDTVPAAAPVGEIISIVGENFAVGVQVFFAGSQIQVGIARVSDTQIEIAVPNRSPGIYDIWIENPDGGISGSAVFLVQGRPSLFGASAFNGLPGAVVSLSGAYFELGAEISFNDLLIPAQFLGSGSLSFSVPAIGPDVVELSVRNPTGLESEPIEFEVLAAPKIIAVVPNSAVAGEQVAVSGAHFKPDIKLYLDDRQVAVVRESSTLLKFEVPAQISGSCSLLAVNPTDNLRSLAVGFTVLRKPQISEIIPASAQPGSKIKVFGADFENPAVLVDGSSIPFTYVGGVLAFVLPERPPGTVLSVRVRNSSSVLSESKELAVLAPILLHSATPQNSAPKTAIELQGAFFPADARVFFGKTEAEVIAVTGDRLSVRVPNLPAVFTEIEVRTFAGAVSTAAISFGVLPALTVSKIEPNPAPPDTEIEIAGSGFDEGVSVFVRDVRAIGLIRVNSSLLKIRIPQLNPGPAPIRVLLPDGRETVFAFTVPAVWISEVSRAAVSTGEYVEIKGIGFVQPIAVAIGGVATDEIEVVSPTLLRIKIPAIY